LSYKAVGNGEDGGQETIGVPKAGVEGGIVNGGRLPWVASGEEIEENDAEGPDIVEQGRISAIMGELSTVAF